MEYREIVSVTGLGGLYQLLATKSDGAIVRNIADKSTKFISARVHNVTPLESIEVYTTGDNVRLHEIFEKMKEKEAATPVADPKTSDNNAIKSYFMATFPELDEERVYVSDMKKMLNWYELLKENDLLKFEIPASTEESTTEESVVAEVAAASEEKPKRAKKVVEKTTDEVDVVEKPAKKAAARKKKTEE